MKRVSVCFEYFRMHKSPAGFPAGDFVFLILWVNSTSFITERSRQERFALFVKRGKTKTFSGEKVLPKSLLNRVALLLLALVRNSFKCSFFTVLTT